MTSTLTLVKENESQEVEIDPTILTKASKYFEKLLNGNFAEAGKKKIVIQCNDLQLGQCLLSFLQQESGKIDFSTIDLFDLLDLADYWLCISEVYDVCKKELDKNWEKYDLDLSITYMEKYDIEEPEIDFENFKSTPFELLNILEKHDIDTNASILFDQCMDEITINWHKYMLPAPGGDIEQIFTIMIKYDYYYFTVDNFGNCNPLDLLKCAEKTKNKRLIKVVEKRLKDFIKYDSTNNMVYDLNLLYYFRKADQIFKKELKTKLEDISSYFDDNYQSLIDSPNLVDLNLGVLKYREPDPNKDYDGTRDYSNSEREADDWDTYKNLCVKIFNKLIDIAENKSERASYLIQQIQEHNYYNEITYDFATKLCSYLSKEEAKRFAQNLFSYKEPNAFKLAQYLF